jgi:hypothetical protein
MTKTTPIPTPYPEMAKLEAAHKVRMTALGVKGAY